MSRIDIIVRDEAASPGADSAGPVVPLVSILVPSRRPHQFAGLIESLRTSLADHRSVEVLAKIDDDDPALLEAYREIARNSPIACKLVVGPRLGGVFTLWIGMEEALAQISKNTYFVIALTDEGRFLTPEWDSFLRSYVGFFPDHVFRLRLSNVTRFVQYANYLTCSTMPESFPIFTRRWLELTEGFTHLSYGFDAYQQAIATRLAIDDTVNRDIWNSRGLYRDIPISGIELGGIDFGKDISEVETITRMMVGTREWLRLVSYREQDHISYLATKLRLYIICKAKFKNSFRLQQNARLKMVSALDKSGEVLATDSYRISRLRNYYSYAHVMIRLLPARLNYFRHEMRIFKPARPLPRLRPAKGYRLPSLRPFSFRFSRLLRFGFRSPGIRSHRPRQNIMPTMWVIRLVRRLPFRIVRPLSLFRFRRALRLPAYLQIPYLVMFGIGGMMRRLRKRRYPSVLVDLLFYPMDRLLWTPPTLCTPPLPRNRFSLFVRLKRLGYPVPNEEEIGREMKRIEALKISEYRDVEY